MEETDLNLVKRVRNGDRTAYQALVERYQRKLFGLCYGMVRNRDDAEDMVQEAFIKAYRNIDRFEGNASFYTWIYRIATNVCIDFLRKKKRARTVDYDDAIERQRDEMSDDASALLPSKLGINPAKVFGRQELLKQIEDALGQLSDKHREAIVLREVQGLSYKEMADIMEVSIGTVMSRLHHARKNMQASLESYVGRDREVKS